MFSDMSKRKKVIEQVEINGIAIGPSLTKEQAKAIFAMGEDAVIFVLMTQAKMAAEQTVSSKPGKHADDPSCPSGQKPPYEKENSQGL